MQQPKQQAKQEPKQWPKQRPKQPLKHKPQSLETCFAFSSFEKVEKGDNTTWQQHDDSNDDNMTKVGLRDNE